ncbi:MAG: hypothetical protein ACQEQV_02455 [Fibrobacterota bacterium]
MRLLVGILLILLVSCSSHRTYVTSFLYRPQVLQYFFSDLQFASDHARMEPDFTFKSDSTLTYSTICNVTLYTQQGRPARADAVCFRADGDTLGLDSISTLYAEGSRGAYRYGGKLTTDQFRRILAADTLSLHVLADTLRFDCGEGPRVREAVAAARQDILFP